MYKNSSMYFILHSSPITNICCVLLIMTVHMYLFTMLACFAVC